MAVFNHDEAEVAELLAEPGTVLGLSDAGAHASQLCDACFSTHLLGHWVRDKAGHRAARGGAHAHVAPGGGVRHHRSRPAGRRSRLPTSQCSIRPPSAPDR
jgi:hypothetical protein